MGDNSFISQPKFMTDEIVDATIKRTFDHCIRNNIKEFLFIFHGGEPLLQKSSFFEYFVNKCNSTFHPYIKAHYTIQTNGTLITDEIAQVFNKLEIKIGVSIDGVKEINDKNRLYKDERSSFKDVLRGIEIAFKHNFHKKSLGVLTVIDIENDPITYYNFLKSLKITSFDFLFPFNNYANLPDNYKINDFKCTPYADWLIPVFELWFNDEDRPHIRIFRGLIECLFGGEFPTDHFGSYKNGLLVIETNGDIEPIDSLKACGDNFTKTDLNILHNQVSDSRTSKLIDLYYNCHNELSYKCTQCPINDICGGGNLVTRYSNLNGFDNPSYLCNDFLKLIIYIQNKIYSLINDGILKKNNISLLSYEETYSRLVSFNQYKNSYLSSFANFNHE